MELLNRSQTEPLYHGQLQFLSEAAFIMLLKYSGKQSTWKLESHISKELQWNEWEEGKNSSGYLQSKKNGTGFDT